MVSEKIPHMEDLFFQKAHEKYKREQKRLLNAKLKKKMWNLDWKSFFRAQKKTDLKVVAHGNNGVSI